MLEILISFNIYLGSINILIHVIQILFFVNASMHLGSVSPSPVSLIDYSIGVNQSHLSLTRTDQSKETQRVLSIWWHKSTQVSFYLCYLLNAKKDRIMFVSTCVTKWKALEVEKLYIYYVDFSNFTIKLESNITRFVSYSVISLISNNEI